MPHEAITGAHRLESVGTSDTAHITGHEWRWVIFAGCALALLAFLPFVWVALRGTPGWQFMGSLHNYQDAATYLAKMRIGAEEGWAVQFLHTPEAHEGALIMLLYPVLGRAATAAGVPLLVMFHASRVIASLIMYAAIYQLGASIWMNIGMRRAFFIIASVGAGFGWLLGPLTGMAEIPDLAVPEAFPIYSTFVNVHFPLAIGCMAMLLGLVISAFRYWGRTTPNMDSMWWVASVLSLLLSVLYPQSLLPIGGALVLYVVIDYLQRRTIDRRTLLWIMAIGIPALPAAAYYLITIQTNPAMAQWNAQNQTLAPPLWTWAAALGLPLIIALPALVRAVRRMERDGDRLMLLLLIAMMISIYLPTNVQRRFAVGMMIPVAYFAVRALQGFWLPRIHRRMRPLLLVGVLVMPITPLFMLFLPAVPAMVGNPDSAAVLFLDTDYAEAYEWLDTHTTSNDVVLASPDGSVWLPGWAGARVVYGHQYETLNAEEKRGEVLAWYSAADRAACAALIEQYRVRYVLYGPEERALGSTVCLDEMPRAATIGDVEIYAP